MWTDADKLTFEQYNQWTASGLTPAQAAMRAAVKTLTRVGMSIINGHEQRGYITGRDLNEAIDAEVRAGVRPAPKPAPEKTGALDDDVQFADINRTGLENPLMKNPLA